MYVTNIRQSVLRIVRYYVKGLKSVRILRGRNGSCLNLKCHNQNKEKRWLLITISPYSLLDMITFV